MAVRDALQSALKDAMGRRDAASVDALRSALSAIANAEAVPVTADPSTAAPGSVHIAGAAAGLGAAEAERVTVSEDELRAIVADEAAELSEHAQRLRRLCRYDEADAAGRAGQVLTGILGAAT